MRTIAVAALVAVAFAGAACSSVSVSTDWDRETDFSQLGSFAWMARAAGDPEPFGGNTLVEKRVVASVERELAARGLVRNDTQPDFLVSVHTLTRERLDVTTWPTWGYGWTGHRGYYGAGGPQRVDVTQVTEGTLVLDFVHPVSKDLLWRGIARSVLDSSSGSPERVDEAIGKLLAGFPPGS